MKRRYIFSLYAKHSMEEIKQERLNHQAEGYEKKLKLYESLKDEKVSRKTIEATIGFSQATYYRYKKVVKSLKNGEELPSKRPKNIRNPLWTQEDAHLILKIRTENPTYGKSKITTILKRDHNRTLSESTVGRIIVKLLTEGRIQKSISSIKTKRKRIFKNHAEAWTFKQYEEMEMGERIQIDHMTVTKNGLTFKHFQAWERKSKFIHADIFSNATSSSAKTFLLDFVKNAPFPIKSIQVDGGSEFMKEFEEACKTLDIPLIVLPPRRPDYNGGVERGNRIFREEFYARNDLTGKTIQHMRDLLKKDALIKYNHYRPHFTLQNLTPMEYINNAHNGA